MEPVTPPPPHLRDLPFTPEVERATRDAWARLRHVIPEVEWPVHAPLIAAINRLKQQRDAVILAHNYQTPEIFHGVADIKGDSLALARRPAHPDLGDRGLRRPFHGRDREAAQPREDRAAARPRGRCSLASSITAADVRALRARHPGVPVVTYVNTSAAVKAETDVCCTSANALRSSRRWGDRVIFIPDEYLGELGREPDHEAGHLLAGPLRGARAVHRHRDRD